MRPAGGDRFAPAGPGLFQGTEALGDLGFSTMTFDRSAARIWRGLGLAAFLVVPGVLAAQQPAAPALRLEAGRPVDPRRPEVFSFEPAFAGQTDAPYRATTAVQVTTITDKLKFPWAVAFLPQGRFLVTEKAGALRIVGADGAISAPISGVPKVFFRTQVGLLDVVLDRRYATNKRIFFTYTEADGDAASRIVVGSATLDEAALALREVKAILRTTPSVPFTQNGNAGARIVQAPDGNLFVITGDRVPMRAEGWEAAQRHDTLLGKILRITPEGKPAPGNPFIGRPGYAPEIWTLGHRSTQGIAFDPKGRLWSIEHGPRGGDELNLIQRGANYGWPLISYGREYRGPLIYGGRTQAPGMEQPRYYWSPVIAPSGLAFYSGRLFPQWRNSVLIGGLIRKSLVRLTISGDRVVDEEPLLTDLDKRVRDVRVGPDGAVYVLTDEAETGRLLRLTPKR